MIKTHLGFVEPERRQVDKDLDRFWRLVELVSRGTFEPQSPNAGGALELDIQMGQPVVRSLA